MVKVVVYNSEGKAAGHVELKKEVFGIEKINQGLVQEVVTAHLANARSGHIAHTKTRSEVRGGGKKPWKQKGTGRARVGSIRSPLWRGGGITFGPRNIRNYTKKINSKAKLQALKMVLSEKVRQKKMLVVDALSITDHKTKHLVKILSSLPKSRSQLLCAEKRDSNLAKSARNLPEVSLIAPRHMNVYDVMLHDVLIITKKAVKELESFCQR